MPSFKAPPCTVPSFCRTPITDDRRNYRLLHQRARSSPIAASRSSVVVSSITLSAPPTSLLRLPAMNIASVTDLFSSNVIYLIRILSFTANSTLFCFDKRGPTSHSETGWRFALLSTRDGCGLNFACVLRYGHPLILCGRKLCRPVFTEVVRLGAALAQTCSDHPSFISCNSPEEGQVHPEQGKCRVSLEAATVRRAPVKFFRK